jgi:transcription elongation factor GreA
VFGPFLREKSFSPIPSMNLVWVSAAQYRKLEEEIRQLENRHAEAARSAGLAAEHGDLSENGELDAAREEMRLLEARIREARDRLARSRILSETGTDDGTVRIGCTVRLRDLDRDSEETYRIVGGGDFDPDAGEIPYTAPLAKGLLGKGRGEVAQITIPAGTRRLEIVEIARPNHS